MYSRYQNYRFGSGIRVPDNYSGNAFTEREEAILEKEERVEPEAVVEARDEQEERLVEESGDEATPSEESAATSQAESAAPASHFKMGPLRLPFKFNIGRLFSGGFGSEELLILALIFLILGESTDDEIILLLALLLFIG